MWIESQQESNSTQFTEAITLSNYEFQGNYPS